MKKIINDPDKFVDEMIEGILLAHPDQVKTPGDDPRILVRADAPVAGQVGIVTGGGSGHLPLFLGYIGEGMIDGAAVGGVFRQRFVLGAHGRTFQHLGFQLLQGLHRVTAAIMRTLRQVWRAWPRAFLAASAC